MQSFKEQVHPQKLLSVVVPVYNEQESLPSFFERLGRVLNGLSDWCSEVIFVDDGSQDESLAILRALREKDQRIRILRLSRNFGSWSALTAGVHAASGDVVAWVSSDLQDPPELIPQLLQRWREGAQVVWGVRAKRHDPWPRRLAASLFYKLLKRIALPQYPSLGTDVCLMDKRVAGLFAQLKEHSRFTQGLIMSLGFRQVTVPYAREKRHTGQSKWGNLSRLLKIGGDMIIGFSHFPLRLALYVGLLSALLTLVWVLVILIKDLVFHIPAANWNWLVPAISFFGALNLITLGMLGEYVWRILEEVRGRPLYVIQEKIGFGSDVPAAQAHEGHVKGEIHDAQHPSSFP